MREDVTWLFKPWSDLLACVLWKSRPSLACNRSHWHSARALLDSIILTLYSFGYTNASLFHLKSLSFFIHSFLYLFIEKQTLMVLSSLWFRKSLKPSDAVEIRLKNKTWRTYRRRLLCVCFIARLSPSSCWHPDWEHILSCSSQWRSVWSVFITPCLCAQWHKWYPSLLLS